MRRARGVGGGGLNQGVERVESGWQQCLRDLGDREFGSCSELDHVTLTSSTAWTPPPFPLAVPEGLVCCSWG